MKKINVDLNVNPYQILIDYGSLNQFGKTIESLKIGRDAVVITNPKVKRLYGKALETSLLKSGFSVKFLTVADGEQSKAQAPAFSLIERLAKYDVFKQVFVVALGGGVIGDLAGYVAATYKRGVPFVQVPTTLLAQVDSSIGGKVGIDLPQGKNLVGSFYQPKVVFSDVSVLKTLEKRQFRNGMAEAVKYGIIYDERLFKFILKNLKQIELFDQKSLIRLVYECSRIKTEVVLEDEKETKGIRTILNFGHTAGHAIEAASSYDRYQHGEAIAVGMRIAAELSYELNLCDEKTVQQVNDALTLVGLPVNVKGVSLPKVMKLMKHDKKFITGKNRFVLCRKIGEVKVVDGIDEKLIRRIISKYLA